MRYEHAGQFAQQIVVLNVNFFFHVMATECSLAYFVLVYAHSTILPDFAEMLVSVARPIIGWAHAADSFPALFSQEDKTTE